MNNPTHRTNILILILLMISTAIRLVQLDSGLWLDEITTLETYARQPFREIVSSFESENQHFLYSLLAHASFLIFGESAWALRLPAVLFGVGSIVALYLFGNQVTRPVESLLAAALMAFSYHHVWFSQNARGYTGMLFWTLLSSWLLLRALRSARLSEWSWFGLAAAFGVYTHLTMLFVVAGQFIVAGVAWSLQQRKPGQPARILPLVFGFGVAGLLTILLHAPVIAQMSSVIGGSQVSVVEAWKSPLWTMREILTGFEIGFSGALVGFGAILILGVGMISFWRSYPEVIGLFILPPLIGAGITLAIGHHLWPRFFFFALGFGALILIRALFVLGKWLANTLRLPDQRAQWFGIGASLLLVAISAASVPFAFGPKQDFDGARAFVESQLLPDDRVVVVSLAADIYNRTYQAGWEEVKSVEQLNQIQAAANRTWFIYTFPEVAEALYPQVMADVEANFSLVEVFWGTVRSGEIYILRSDRVLQSSRTIPGIRGAEGSTQ
ncbi:MAG: glycosyltransferase family 39 protein [Anaerolineales bacterium]|jgi:uncharacterized membrane protein|nr:glycosyltransferase family 39 protein [Anaerolineales bacterium]